MKKLPTMISARQARFRFVDEDFVQGMISVSEAILMAAPETHEVIVNIPTGNKGHGEWSVAYHVCQRLRELDYEVNCIHDPENGSSELKINWMRRLDNL